MAILGYSCLSVMTIRLTFLEVVHVPVEVTLLKIKVTCYVKCSQTNILSTQVLLCTAASSSYFVSNKNCQCCLSKQNSYMFIFYTFLLVGIVN